MSPKYASALLGLTNTIGAVPGIIGVATVGQLYDMTHDWTLALFAPSALCMLGGSIVYTGFAQNSPIDFDKDGDNAPFGFEKHIAWLPARLGWGRSSDISKDQ
jgi:ACS family sodium-dependent inorganic phosphate cotransporter